MIYGQGGTVVTPKHGPGAAAQYGMGDNMYAFMNAGFVGQRLFDGVSSELIIAYMHPIG